MPPKSQYRHIVWLNNYVKVSDFHENLNACLLDCVKEDYKNLLALPNAQEQLEPSKIAIYVNTPERNYLVRVLKTTLMPELQPVKSDKPYYNLFIYTVADDTSWFNSIGNLVFTGGIYEPHDIVDLNIAAAL